MESQDAESVINELEAHLEEKARLMTLSDHLTDPRYELLSAHYDPANGSFVVMAERDPKLKPASAMRELGYASPSPFTAWTRDERVPELRDAQGIRTYYDMKRADASIRAALRYVKTPVLAARWYVEPASDSPLDKNIAKFVEENLFKRMVQPWHRTLEDALLMCEYGYSPLEKVFDIDSDGKLFLTKLAPRHPLDIKEWQYDLAGGPDGIVMNPTEANGWEDIHIPIEKLVVFVLEQEAGDMRGISILRSAYKHYYYKDTLYKIDAIQKERHGIGIPVIKLPLGFTDDDKSLAEDMGRNLRTNERAHVVIPENWTIEFAQLGGNPVDCLPSIKHHNDQIMGNILVPFYDDPSSKEDTMGMYYKSTRYIANTIAETFNRYVIKQLVDFNWVRGDYPVLRARRIGEYEDLRTFSFAYRNFVGAGTIIPDMRLEKFIRNELDLPEPEPETARVVASPQNPNSTREDANKPDAPKPPKVGAPRQATSPPVATPRTNAGRDSSGAK
jgi:hypothetical protein